MGSRLRWANFYNLLQFYAFNNVAGVQNAMDKIIIMYNITDPML